MRSAFFFIVASIFFTASLAQENQSVDPAWLYVPEAVAEDELVLIEPVMGSDIPVELRFVELLDGIYAPIGVRKPEGAGPFPPVVFAPMTGGDG